MPKLIRPKDALEYHSKTRPGKIEVVPTKPTNTQRDLALAYSPGVAEPCKLIAKNPKKAYDYTSKGNLVAVVSNGTAVLGLGNIGPEASKPVMEGKGVLFKVFADIDVFDLELDATDVDEFVKVVKALEPTFGGVNLEDIAAPECFEIEERLKEAMNIPVMHDDQHGTAIISGAALLNALELAEKNIADVRIVVSGAGASAMSCTKLIISLGASPENVIMCDSKGPIRKDRESLSAQKAQFATSRDVNSLAEALEGADVFLGLSKGGIMSAAMLKSMAPRAIVFAMANPDPEIDYPLAVETRNDIIMATGRSDFPNQVNNVLGFPFIFRGALDVKATRINEEMKLAAVHSLAKLAKKPVPDIVMMAYNQPGMAFGNEYIIPKPVDPRLITTVAPAVAKAAMDSGVAGSPIIDWDQYEKDLKKRMGLENQLIQAVISRAKRTPKRIVFPEAESPSILKAAQLLIDEGTVKPILLGNIYKINKILEEHNLELPPEIEIIDPIFEEEKRDEYAQLFFQKRQRKGLTLLEAESLMKMRNYFGLCMVEAGDADGFVGGHTRKYNEVLKPALQIIGREEGVRKVAGMYIMLTKKGILFLADATINISLETEDLVGIAELATRIVRSFNLEPRIAMLSYSNFGSAMAEESKKISKAASILKERNPDLVVDGEVQANFALNKDLMKEYFPFSELAEGKNNVLIFPNLSAANISYKLLQSVAGIEAIGPILLGMNKPVHILQMGCSVREIMNMAAIAVMDAQQKEQRD